MSFTYFARDFVSSRRGAAKSSRRAVADCAAGADSRGMPPRQTQINALMAIPRVFDFDSSGSALGWNFYVGEESVLSHSRCTLGEVGCEFMTSDSLR